MWTQRDTLDSLFWENAIDDMGIYPAKIFIDGVLKERTEWQDGWNAAVIELTNKHSQFLRWSKTLTTEQREQLIELLDKDGEPVRLTFRDDKVELSIQCNDTFAYACGDAERFTIEDLPEIVRMWDKHHWDGLIALIAKKRNQEPVKEIRIDAGYLKAKADL